MTTFALRTTRPAPSMSQYTTTIEAEDYAAAVKLAHGQALMQSTSVTLHWCHSSGTPAMYWMHRIDSVGRWLDRNHPAGPIEGQRPERELPIWARLVS